MTVMNRMPLISIVFGILLDALATTTFLMSHSPSFTVWIPSIIGMPILIAGVIAMKPEMLKHAMHGAAMFGLLGFLASAGRLLSTAIKGEFVWKLATVSQALMALLCGLFVALCVKSFIEARKARQAAAS
jgi:hypothetical protein